MLPGVKTTNYVLGRIGLKKAQEKGAHEGLYRDSFGVVREGVTSNVMMLSKGTVYTPGRDCLDGVTLRAIRRVAGAEGLGWVASTLRLEAMKDADEIWISSSIREMLPVTSLDGHMIGAGVPGPMFEQIYRALRLGFEQESYGDNQAYLPRLA
jgi:branched-chain amino acid aminotransferase